MAMMFAGDTYLIAWLLHWLVPTLLHPATAPRTRGTLAKLLAHLLGGFAGALGSRIRRTVSLVGSHNEKRIQDSRTKTMSQQLDQGH